jgi:hypothetical protein
MHLDLGLGVAGLALPREGTACQYGAVPGISPFQVVVLVDGWLALPGQEREVAPGVGLEGLKDEFPDLSRGVGLLLLELEQPLSPRLDNNLPGGQSPRRPALGVG